MSFLPAISSWLKRNRTSARMAFLLRMIAMGVGSLFSLLWMRLLLRAMGDPLLGLFQNFQALTRLGGLGDFGITGALSLRAGTMLGSGDEKGLRSLLASARTLFLFLACGLCILFVGLSPWLPKWLNFESVSGAGSMTLLFVYGGMSLMLFIIGGYFASLNYAHATVTWPILPTVLFLQVLAPFFHWRLALLHMPLWVQLLPYLASAASLALLSWAMLKWSHPWLGDVIPLKQDRSEWKTLAGASWWMYLVSIGSVLYFTTDRLVIGAVLGTAVIPTYQANYRVCELCVTLITTAAFVGFPKVTQWIASPHEADRRRALTELNRLSVFEVVLACGAVLGYIAFNNLFVGIWLDKAHQAPLAWEFAFAFNLAVTCGGNAGIQLSMRAGDKGLRSAGLIVAGTGLLNLALSIVSVKCGSITGVAVATVIAQSISSIFLGAVTCRYLGLPVGRWMARCWLLPVAFTLTAAALKTVFPDNSLRHLSLLSTCYVGLFVVVCWLVGLNRELLRTELNQARALFSTRR
ncbi:MAG TPA: oligosaccharide flippase family protein [Verrucomicrobiae bacterium]|jgi:O-antigen/teichoic acid export membrane protein|nr:oligosaccharide flippase family protein [Verrucomicrobiae bacterium]